MNTKALLKLQNGSDIRGIAMEGILDEHVTLTENACNRIGRSFARWLISRTAKIGIVKIGIGRDSRLTGEKLAEAVKQGLLAEKCEVIDCGLATTPSLFMATVFAQTNFDGAIMITASHLPFNRNGIKFFDRSGGLEHEDITDILTSAEDVSVSDVTSSACKTIDLISLYADYLKHTICSELHVTDREKPLTGLHIIVDAGNGCGGFFVEKILQPLGADTTGSCFLDPDGHFPNHIPNPENKDAMASIKKATVNYHANLGLIFDTDVDRMSAVFDTGAEINRDAIIALISAILAPSYPGSTIITDSVTSDRLTFFIEKKLGLIHLRYMRGYKNVIDKCKELNKKGIVSPLAMETSGHGALKDNYYLDDGAFLAVKLIIAVANAKREGKKIDNLISDLPPAGDESEYRFKITAEDFKSYGNIILSEFKKQALSAGYDLPKSYEGVRISFHDNNIQGWMLLRLSLHDPVMPLNIEGFRSGDKDKIAAIAKQFLFTFDQLDITSLSK